MQVIYVLVLHCFQCLDKELKRKYPSSDYSITGYRSDKISDGEFFVKDNENDEVYSAFVEIPDGGSKAYIEKDCFYNSIFKDKMEEKYDEINYENLMKFEEFTEFKTIYYIH